MTKSSLGASLLILAAALSLIILAAAPAIGQTSMTVIPPWSSGVPPAMPITGGWPRLITPRTILPPAQYDKPYMGALYVVRMNDFAIFLRVCGDRMLLACAINSEKSCLIVLGPVAQDDDRVMRHEIGHCNGWPGHHPGMRQ